LLNQFKASKIPLFSREIDEQSFVSMQELYRMYREVKNEEGDSSRVNHDMMVLRGQVEARDREIEAMQNKMGEIREEMGHANSKVKELKD
jgi:hypothetical protein